VTKASDREPPSFGGVWRDRAAAERAARSMGWLAVQRALDVVAGAFFVLLVPRLLGPADFGRWALATSIALWFSAVSSMSSTQVAVRFLPALAARSAREELLRILGGLLAVRLLGGAVAALVYFALTASWLRDLDLTAVALIAGTVFLRSVAKLLFAFFLGLGSPARWGVGEALHRWFAVACIVPGVVLGGLRGACWGLVAAEILVLAVGLFWARSLLSWRHLRIIRGELAPYLRFGATFAAGSLLLAFSQRSGELLLRLGVDDYAAVGAFGVGYRAYLTGLFTIWHLSMAFAPELSAMAAAGRRDELVRWAERLRTAGAVLGTTAFLAAVFLGDHVVRLALGARFAPAAPHLAPLALAFVAMALGAICRLEAVVLDRWKMTLAGALLHLTTFWACGWLLVARIGPVGASLAALLAAAVYGGFMALAARRASGHRLGRWTRAVALGLPFAALAPLGGGAAADALLCALAFAAYAALLLRLGVVTMSELAALRDVLRRSPPAVD
jgi:O-antigen/teichoic acid export membrane protein